MWEMVQDQDRAGLKKFIEWQEDFYSPNAFFKGAPNVESRLVGYASRFGSSPHESEIEAAAVFQLIFMLNRGLNPGARLELAYDPIRKKTKLRYVPIDLLACLWLQLAETISENKRHRQCPGCGNWFEIGGGRGRTDKKYCGDACRMRVNREAQEKVKVKAMQRIRKTRSKKEKGR
jgi:hypothetical protein